MPRIAIMYICAFASLVCWHVGMSLLTHKSGRAVSDVGTTVAPDHLSLSLEGLMVKKPPAHSSGKANPVFTGMDGGGGEWIET